MEWLDEVNKRAPGKTASTMPTTAQHNQNVQGLQALLARHMGADDGNR